MKDQNIQNKIKCANALHVFRSETIHFQLEKHWLMNCTSNSYERHEQALHAEPILTFG